MPVMPKIIDLILNDDLNKAELLLKQNSAGFEFVLSLLKMVKDKPLPLEKLKAKVPTVIKISISYTCRLKCEMCGIGFPYQSSIFKDRKYLLPEEFNKLSPWIERASLVAFCGEGETMDSPHVFEFLKTLKGKTTSLVTSGVSLTSDKTKLLVEAKLDVLHFSFDGRTSAGHGAGKEKYIRNFWEKVKNVKKIKKSLHSNIPALGLQTVVNAENINTLDDLFETAYKHDVMDIMLIPMFVHKEALLKKTIFKNYEESKIKINTTISRWTKRGMGITVMNQHKRMRDSIYPCFYVDNLIEFRTQLDLPFICCNTLTIPLEFNGNSISKYFNSFPFRYLRYLHFCSEPGMLPEICQTCWVIRIKKYYETRPAAFKNGTARKASTLYSKASSLKNNNCLEKSEKMFLRILDLEPESSLRGKTYFHLGEINIMKKKYQEALSLMKLAVQYCFNHKKAFVYLYLLLMLLEDQEIFKRKKKAYFNYLKHRLS